MQVLEVIFTPPPNSVSGIISLIYVLCVDPIFYLHHANLDRVYWEWQSQNLAARLHDVSGSVELLGPITGPNVTLAFPIELGLLAPQVTIRDLMDIKGVKSKTGVLCYDYADSVGVSGGKE